MTWWMLRLMNLEARHEEEGTTAALIRGVTADLKGKGYEVKGFRLT